MGLNPREVTMKKAFGTTVLILGAAAALLAQGTAPQAAKPLDPWGKLAFLLGDWVGIGTGAPGEAVGGSAFAFALDKSVLVRTNWAKYPPKAGEKTGLSHEDLLYIYPEGAGGGLRAIYFDNEKHVISYIVSFPAKVDAVTFESDPAQKGPRYRMTYELAADKTLKNAFFIAMPGQDFKPYTEGTLKRK
jgi:hypothetical protein